jgi:O-antigen ligase
MHFYVIVLCLFFQALTWGMGYRLLAYLNLLLVVIMTLFYRRQTMRVNTGFVLGIGLLLMMIVAEWIATTDFSFTVKPIRNVLLAVGLLTGAALLSAYHLQIKPKLIPALIGLSYAYTVAQLIAVYLLAQPYGTTKNPHYLAIYSAVFLTVNIFLIIKHTALMQRCVLVLASVMLGTLLLNTSSRPIWIGLILAILIVTFCLQRRTALLLLAGSGLLFAGLAMTNAGDFKARWQDLILHINTEERVTIWQDAWQMQESNSNDLQWISGHGFESFAKDFSNYSRYHMNEHIDFNSPHNIALELLYQFGLVGVTLVLFSICVLYFRIISDYVKSRDMNHYAWVYLLLLMILTIDFFSVSITLPFFVSINLNIVALVTGVSLYLRNIERY